jgi:hypothetical protein
MIVEERDYTLKAGKLGAFVESYRDHGLQIQLDYLGAFQGYFTSEIDELNDVVARWSYTSLDDRQARRARLLADPLWQAYLDKVVDLIQLQNTRIPADAWDGHQPTSVRRGSCHTSHVGVDRGDRSHHCGSCRNQSPHGDRENQRSPRLL